MLNQKYRLFEIHPTNWGAKNILATVSLVLLALTSGCVPKSQKEVQLEIKSIQQQGSDGLYNISGTTNLPESSWITVTAVRYLTTVAPEQAVSKNSDAEIKRSILSRQLVKVKQGQWQTELNLWKVAANGKIQEVWQGNETTKQLNPQQEVTFIATYDPANQSLKTETAEKKEAEEKPQILEIEGKLVRFTPEGEEFVQASQSLAIPLPTGKTAPPVSTAEELNGGWGNRYQITLKTGTSTAKATPIKEFSQTNAPLSEAEYLR